MDVELRLWGANGDGGCNLIGYGSTHSIDNCELTRGTKKGVDKQPESWGLPTMNGDAKEEALFGFETTTHYLCKYIGIPKTKSLS